MTPEPNGGQIRGGPCGAVNFGESGQQDAFNSLFETAFNCSQNPCAKLNYPFPPGEVVVYRVG